MKRRTFIKQSAAAASIPFWLQGCDFLPRDDFPISVRSDHATGHLMFESQSWPEIVDKEINIMSMFVEIIGTIK